MVPVTLSLGLVVGLAGCGSGASGPARGPVTPGAATAGPNSTATGPAGGGAPAPSTPTPTEPVEPTTTNTLPPPPAPTRAAPSVAGSLTAADLPVPAGWRRAKLPGGEEEGFRGNGTWVHARDPRYAAQDAITVGCADVTRDDYPDPVAALEGNFRRGSSSPGVGLVLQFGTEQDAAAYTWRYRAQVEACQTLTDPVRTTIVPSPAGLIDRRDYPDGRWTEVARQRGTRLTLVILSEDSAPVSVADAQRLLARLA